MNIIALFFCCFFTFIAQAQTQIRVVTENYPPFQRLNTQGDIEGVATELVSKLLHKAQLPHQILLYPWPRALKELKKSPNTLLYSMLKLPSRNADYKWLVPLCTVSMSFYHLASRNNITINELSDIKNYRIGVERAQGNKDYLITQGFESNLIEVNNNEQLRKMMLFNRVDLILISDAYAATLTPKDDIQLSKAFTVKELEQQLYLVSNIDLPPSIENNIYNAYLALNKQQQFQCNY